MKIPPVGATLIELGQLYAYTIDRAPRLLFDLLFPEKIKPEDYYWSEVTSPWQPKVRLTDGTWSGNGVMWRRRRKSDDRWEYRQDEETVEEQMDRII